MCIRDSIIAQINNFNGNISKTAKFIGMDRSALHRKLNDLNIKTKKKLQSAISN